MSAALLEREDIMNKGKAKTENRKKVPSLYSIQFILNDVSIQFMIHLTMEVASENQSIEDTNCFNGSNFSDADRLTTAKKRSSSKISTGKNQSPNALKRDHDRKEWLYQQYSYILSLADYELEVDPYRGIFDENKNDFASCAGALSDGVTKDSMPCPCVVDWIQEAERKSSGVSKKTKRRKSNNCKKTKSGSFNQTECDNEKENTGSDVPALNDLSEISTIQVNKVGTIRRNPSSTFICSCDFNPFCLATLGGPVDHYLNAMISREENAQSTCKTGGETAVESENANETASTGDIVDKSGITLDPLLSDLSTSTNTVDEEYECGQRVEKDHILRKMTKVDCEKVTNHLKTIIFTEHGGDYQIALCNIIDWHQQLIYDGNRKGNQDGKIAFCKPVGLRNLGATCYLNSQLQCLVANLPFVEGVFNWTEKGASMNQMNLVISRLQCILARMIYGPHNVVCTDEFSSSMAIENDEMQDPNEFARLLLDRMDESFQRDSAELRNLLPSIFRGTFEFATKCMQCQKVSRRQENFMDINVPMMPLTSSAKEVTIEQLLAEYFKPEKLDGENKYMCGECNDICDAERSISFVATPPVLNIQLARYVFNLKTYRKQKLMNKVMLPRFLCIDENNSDKRKYILCAVQNHRGSSAYSGHYVAEVMDWITGVWFEFDDEKVTLLEHGPSSSYDPDRNLGTRLKGGTSDAYNLFYVEESFLRKSVLFSIDRMNSTPQDVVKALTVERQHAFEVEKQLNEQKQKFRNRLAKRWENILTAMLSHEASSGKKEIWVEGSTLRRFFSHNDSMQDILSSTDKPILAHRRLRCKHGKGLHPRIAHEGKLLTLKQFEVYTELLGAERDYILSNQCMSSSVPVCDLVIHRDTNLYCPDCAEEYKSDLKAKLANLGKLISLYDSLDPNTDHEHFSICNRDKGSYAIARSFSTSCRKLVLERLKRICSNGESSIINLSYNLAMDSFDATKVIPLSLSGDDDASNTSNDKSPIDPLVNSRILCEHGHCNKINNSQIVKCVSEDVWRTILFFFPSAICIPVSYVDDKAQSCIICTQIKEDKSNMVTNLIDWATSSARDTSDKSILVQGIVGEYRLVHTKDIERWQKIIKMPQKSRKRDWVSFEKLKNQMKRMLYNSSSPDCDPGSKELHFKCHRLTCIDHERPILSINRFRELHTFSSGSPISETKYREDVPLTLISDELYASYMSSLLRLETILTDKNETILTDTNENFDFPNDSFSSLKQHHPKVTLTKMGVDGNDGEAAIIIESLLSSNIDGYNLRLSKAPCSNVTCMERYHQYLQTLSSVDDFDSKKKSDLDNKLKNPHECYKFIIHEYDASLDAAAVQSILENDSRLRSEDESTVQTNIRRSSRKKNLTSKTAFELNVDKSKNLAQLRLLIYEKCNNKRISTQQLWLFWYNADLREGMMIELLGVWNELTMEEVLKDIPAPIVDQPEIIIALVSACSTHSLNCTETETSIIEEDEVVLDSLMKLATQDDCETPGGETGRKSKRGRERGFAGTFLQSSVLSDEQDINAANSKPSSSDAVMIDLCLEE